MRLKRPSKHLWRTSLLAICVAFLGCSDSPTSSAEPEIDRIDMFVRDTREFPGEEVEFELRRTASGSSLKVWRPAREWRARLLLDSIGPGAEEPEEIREILASFDLWALSAREAPGASCGTQNGAWTCHHASNDYTLVMGVGSGDTYTPQRYSHLELVPATQPVRMLADYVLEWARRLEQGR